MPTPSPDPTTLPDGLHTADSTSPEYAGLRYLANVGAAQVVEERSLPGGVVELTINKGLIRQNPVEEAGVVEASGTMDITPKWLRDNVMRDYVSWREAWWREAVQNSVDAGATTIRLWAKQQDDGTWLVGCEDDGRGMSVEVMEHPEEGFLVFGGTTKIGARAGTGAFGKAKEVLVLPWLSWRIATLGKEWFGVGRQWQRRSVKHHQGVVLEVVMPSDMHTDDTVAMAFLEKCWLPSLRFVVNEHRVTTKMPVPDQLVYEDDIGKVYQGKRERASQVYVRKNGIWMFSRELPEHAKHSLVVEVTADSKAAFTQSRDEFLSHSLKWKLEDFRTEMATEGKVLTRRKQQFANIFRGEGKFVLPRRAKEVADALGPMPPITTAHLELDGPGLERLGEILKMFLTQDASSPPSETVGQVDPRVAVQMLTGAKLDGQRRLEAVLKQLVWKPDFYVLKDEGFDFHIPKRFLPDTFTPTVHKLARVWAELCRLVLIELGSESEYGVGWWFSEEAAAGYLRDSGEHWLLLNPFKSIDARSDMYNPSDPKDQAHLWSKAIHEVTHMYDGVSRHTDSYASALTRNIALLADSWPKAKRVVRSIKTRAAAASDKRAISKGEAAKLDELLLVLSLLWDYANIGEATPGMVEQAKTVLTHLVGASEMTFWDGVEFCNNLARNRVAYIMGGLVALTLNPAFARPPEVGLQLIVPSRFAETGGYPSQLAKAEARWTALRSRSEQTANPQMPFLRFGYMSAGWQAHPILSTSTTSTFAESWSTTPP